MSDIRVPSDLLLAVKRDLRPVRPLASPGRRAFMLIPVALALLVLAPQFWGWRSNLDDLSLWISWGLSLLEVMAGLLILAAGLREAIPGRELSTMTVLALMLATLAGYVGSVFLTAWLLPTNVPPEIEVRFVWECVGMTATFSVPALAIAVALVARGLPNRPALTGAICGLGVGIMADAGVRLFCWFTEPAHVLIAHGGAIVMLMLIGAGCAMLVDRMRARRR
jgi:hypothetical protein